VFLGRFRVELLDPKKMEISGELRERKKKMEISGGLWGKWKFLISCISVVVHD